MTSVYAVSTAPTIVVKRPPRATVREAVSALADALHAPEERWAVAHGLTVERVGTTRVYRHPLFTARQGVAR